MKKTRRVSGVIKNVFGVSDRRVFLEWENETGGLSQFVLCAGDLPFGDDELRANIGKRLTVQIEAEITEKGVIGEIECRCDPEEFNTPNHVCAGCLKDVRFLKGVEFDSYGVCGCPFILWSWDGKEKTLTRSGREKWGTVPHDVIEPKWIEPKDRLGQER